MISGSRETDRDKKEKPVEEPLWAGYHFDQLRLNPVRDSLRNPLECTYLRIFPPKDKRLHIYPLTSFTPWLRVAPRGSKFPIGPVIQNGFRELLWLWRELWDGETEMQEWGGLAACVGTVQHLCSWNQRKWCEASKVSLTVYRLHLSDPVLPYIKSILSRIV